MTNSCRALVAVAVAAASLAARPARACDDDRGLPYPASRPPPPAYAPPAYAPPPPVWREPSPWWRRASLERAARELRREEARLEWRRERFYERFGWNPAGVARFEGWYAARRAELDRRWAELSR